MAKELKRELSLTHATVLNMIDMVGIGPFVTLPIILFAMPGKFSIIPWAIGAVLAFADGSVWAELGAAWPKAGGSYIFLQKLFRGKAGRMMAFLYVVQTSLHTPLVITSAALGFINYFKFIAPLSFIEGKLMMTAIVLIVIFFLYRKVIDVGKIGVVLSVIVVTMLLWTIVTGAMAFEAAVYQANSVYKGASGLWTAGFWFVAGNYSSKAVYSFLGYYNVCHFGSEIKNPEKNIPRSILLSVAGIAVLYLAMQFTVSGAVEQKLITDENVPLISILFQKVYGVTTALVATSLLLIVAISSLFALLLGYSRIIWAAASEGMHFKIFAHLHPTKNFPDYALLIFGGIAIVFCLIFNKASDVFRFIVVTRIFIQFIPQAIGVILLRVQKKQMLLPYKMFLFPLPAIVSVLIWLFVFISSGLKYSLFGLAVISAGLLLYLMIFHKKQIVKNKKN
ncbi:APC family permease [soil metagenome]